MSQRNCRHESACIKVLSDAGTVPVNEIGESREALGREPISDPGQKDSDIGSEYGNSDFESHDDEALLSRPGDIVSMGEINGRSPNNSHDVSAVVTGGKLLYQPQC